MEEPKCYKCDCYLDYEGLEDESFQGSLSIATWRGSCPECGKSFRWKEVYKLHSFEDLKEIT